MRVWFDILPARETLTSKEFAFVMGWKTDTARIQRVRSPDSPPFTKHANGRITYKTDDVIKFAQSLPPRQQARIANFHGIAK